MVAKQKKQLKNTKWKLISEQNVITNKQRNLLVSSTGVFLLESMFCVTGTERVPGRSPELSAWFEFLQCFEAPISGPDFGTQVSAGPVSTNCRWTFVLG
jgi:hypothetical protein